MVGGGERGPRQPPNHTIQAAMASAVAPLVVATYNVLYTGFTKHARDWHRSGRADGLETEAQRASRHAALAADIAAMRANVLLLQEADADALAVVRAQGYAVESHFPQGAEGVAVAVRDPVRLTAATPPRRMASSDGKRAALVVSTNRGDFGSFHLPGGPGSAGDRALMLAHLGVAAPAVVGGDWNTTPEDPAMSSLDAAVAASGLQRVAFAGPSGMTSLSTPAAPTLLQIDHLATTVGDVVVVSCAPAGTPTPPWGARAVASDHVPVVAEVLM